MGGQRWNDRGGGAPKDAAFFEQPGGTGLFRCSDDATHNKPRGEFPIPAGASTSLHTTRTVATQPLDETAKESTKNAAKIAFGIVISLIMPGLPLLIIGSTSTSEDRLGMIIPGAILTSIGSLALIIMLLMWGGSRKQESGPKSSIDILEATTKNGVYFRINNPPTSNDAWVGIYPRGSEDSDHGEEGVRWHWLRDIDVNKARFYEKSEGRWSIRVFSDSGYTLDSQDDFEVIPKDDQWWKD